MELNPEQKMAELKDRSNNRPRRGLPEGMRKCPFQSGFEDIPCTPDCALYRQKKPKGYACPFVELDSISWAVKGSPQKKWDGQHKY